LSTELQNDDYSIHYLPLLPTDWQFRYQWSPLSRENTGRGHVFTGFTLFTYTVFCESGWL